MRRKQSYTVWILAVLWAPGLAAGQGMLPEWGVARVHLLTPSSCSVVTSTDDRLLVDKAGSRVRQVGGVIECPTVKMAADGVAALEFHVHNAERHALYFCTPDIGLDACHQPDPVGAERGLFSETRCGEYSDELDFLFPSQPPPLVRAWYRVPDEFSGLGVDPSLPTRELTILVDNNSTDGGSWTKWEIPVELTRPPLVLVHGLWSSAETWRFDLVDDERLPVVVRADYSATNAASFLENGVRGVVVQAIDEAFEEMQGQERVAAQVDVAGHSMGGLLSRIFSTSPLGQKEICDAVGPIRKLVTLDSPHLGAALANRLYDLADEPTFSVFAAKRGFPVDQGAIKDLRIGSPAILGLRLVDVPSHALVGVGGDFFLDVHQNATIARVIRRLILMHPDIETPEDIFENERHDLVVAETSQKGGLTVPVESAFEYPHGIHFGIKEAPGVTGSNAYGERIFELLDTPTSASEWSSFPGNSAIASEVEPRRFALRFRQADDSRPTSSLQGITVTITSPVPGTVVAPGQPVTVTVSVALDQPVGVVDVGGIGTSAEATRSPYVVSLLIPEDVVGPFEISAFAFTTKGEIFGAEPVVVVAQPTAALTGIRISPDKVYVQARGKGRDQQLHLYGLYAEHIEREIDPTGATWFSSDTSIATVGPDGVISGLAEGGTTVTARLRGGVVATAEVEVGSGVFAIFGEDFDGVNYDPWTEIVGMAAVDEAGYCNTSGLRVLVESQEPAFALSNHPDDEPIYFADFYVRLESLAMAEGDEFDLLVADNDDSDPQLKLRISRSGTEFLLRWWLATSGGPLETPSGEEIPIPGEWSVVQVAWRASEPGAADGYLVFYVNGETFEVITNVDNKSSRIDAVRLGAVGDLDPGTSGSFSLDSFVSTRAFGSPSELAACGRALRRDPVRLRFGDVPVGQSGEPREIIVRSIGSEPVTVEAVNIEVLPGTGGTPFALAGVTCVQGGQLPITLAPGQSCGLVVEFTPEEPGFAQAEVTIVSDAVVVKPTSSPVELWGNGVAASND